MGAQDARFGDAGACNGVLGRQTKPQQRGAGAPVCGLGRCRLVRTRNGCGLGSQGMGGTAVPRAHGFCAQCSTNSANEWCGGGARMAEMARCSLSTTAPVGSRRSARSARSTGPVRQRWVPPTVSAQTRLKQTQQPLRPPTQVQTRQPRHFPDQWAPRRWCAFPKRRSSPNY